ncbi:hypothetical protein ABR737_41140 [Streptomyces sp. Edi2]|uniref:hypothetical protein n=1 Tax=Streptomyces sp. Edi2 TaxID=3162528 RepID=UPI0033062E69
MGTGPLPPTAGSTAETVPGRPQPGTPQATEDRLRRRWGLLRTWQGLDPQAAVLLAAWLETTASLQGRAEKREDIEGAAPLVALATRFAHVYLRTTTAR